MSATSQLPNLSIAQRNLLLAALSSNKRNKSSSAGSEQQQVTDYFPSFSAGQKTQQSPGVTSVNPAIFDINQSAVGYDSTFDDSLLSLDDSNNFDLGLVKPGPNAYDIDVHEKRKSPNDEDDDDEDDYDHKKQEGDDKSTKKPGRKLITAEPTSVRLSTFHCMVA